MRKLKLGSLFDGNGMTLTVMIYVIDGCRQALLNEKGGDPGETEMA